tara:strand:- start:89 stop:463 length:375 start_codon:yes stop_codon:yes gene_type:complete
VNNILKIGFVVFIIFVTAIIVYSISTSEGFGDNYIEQLRISDADDTLSNLSDEILIKIGKSVCNETKNWVNQKTSILSIQNILILNGKNIESNNRIIPIIRFQSIYELCPENINVLEEIFSSNE